MILLLRRKRLLKDKRKTLRKSERILDEIDQLEKRRLAVEMLGSIPHGFTLDRIDRIEYRK